jgi:hypothetical protein
VERWSIGAGMIDVNGAACVPAAGGEEDGAGELRVAEGVTPAMDWSAAGVGAGEGDGWDAGGGGGGETELLKLGGG